MLQIMKCSFVYVRAKHMFKEKARVGNKNEEKGFDQTLSYRSMYPHATSFTEGTLFPIAWGWNTAMFHRERPLLNLDKHSYLLLILPR